MARHKTGSALDAAFKKVEEAPSTPVVPPSPQPAAKAKRTDRTNKVLIGGHFDESVRQQLRLLAAEKNQTSQELLGEALDDLFAKNGKARFME